jgi:hypothetical protein
MLSVSYLSVLKKIGWTVTFPIPMLVDRNTRAPRLRLRLLAAALLARLLHVRPSLTKRADVLGPIVNVGCPSIT